MSNYFLDIRLGDVKKDNSRIVEQSLVDTTANIIGTAYKGPAFVPLKIFSQDVIDNTEVYNTQIKTLGTIRQNSFGHLYDEYACLTDSLSYNAVDLWFGNGGQYCSFTRVLGIGDGTKNNSTGKMNNSGFNASSFISSNNLSQRKSKNINAVDNNLAVSGNVTFVLKSFNEISLRAENDNTPTINNNFIDVDTVDYLSELGFDENASSRLENYFLTDVVIAPDRVLPSIKEVVNENNIYSYENTAASYATQVVSINDKRRQFFINLDGFKPFYEEYNTDINKPSSYFQVDLGENVNQIEKQQIYSNPDKNYFSNRFVERGHLVYSTFTFGGLNNKLKEQKIALLTTKPYSEVNNPNVPDYNSFESEFTTAKTPWITSQPLDRQGMLNNRIDIHQKSQDLFRFWSLDDGDVGNRFRIKINPTRRGDTEIETNFSFKDTFATFDIYIFEYDARINKFTQVENYEDVDLNPDSENYICRLIGTKKTYFDFNSNKVIEEGKFKNRSQFLRVEISEKIDEKVFKNQHELIPSGFRSYPHIKINKGAFSHYDNSLNGPDITSLSRNGFFHLPPMYKLNAYKEYANMEHILVEELNEVSWGVLFNDAQVKNNKLLRLSDSVIEDNVSPHFYYSKYFLSDLKNTTHNIWLQEDNYLNSFFHLEKIVYKSLKGLDESRYKHSGRPTENAEWAYVNLDSDEIWNSSRRLKNIKFKNKLSFDLFTYGGFDGVDIRDKDKKYFKNEALLRESYDSGETKTTQIAYKKAIEIAAEFSNCAGDVLVVPGASENSILKKCADVCVKDKRHFYLADIKSSYSSILVEYRDNNLQLLHTSLGISGNYYNIKNSLSNYVLNESKNINTTDIDSVINYKKIFKSNLNNTINSWKNNGIESRYVLPLLGESIVFSAIENGIDTINKQISPDVFVLGKIAQTSILPRISLITNIADISSRQLRNNLSFKILDNENLHQNGINFDEVEFSSRQSKVNLLFKPKDDDQINLLSENTSYENRKSIFQKQSIIRTLQEIKKRIKYDIFLNDSVISGGLFFTQNSSLNNIYQKIEIQLNSLLDSFVNSGFVEDYKIHIQKKEDTRTIIDMQNYIIRGNIIIQFNQSDIISLRLDEILSDLSINAGDLQDSVFIPNV